MATKTISITQEAYDRLKISKFETESFTDVINRITNKRSIMELAGILTKAEGSRLEKNIKGRRLISRNRLSKISEKLK